MADKKTVLILEDEKPLAHALQLKLKHSGFIPVIAKNGKEGLEKIKEGKVDLVVADLIMPEMDGFAFLEAHTSKVPVIVLSNLSQEEDKQRALDLGAKDFFVKSNIQIVDVVKKIEQILA